MTLKEKLQKYEYNTRLENHSIGNQNVYRLYFVNYYKKGKNYADNDIDAVDWSFKPFMPLIV